jgi:hypothetical protein
MFGLRTLVLLQRGTPMPAANIEQEKVTHSFAGHPAADYVLGLFDENDWVCVAMIRDKAVVQWFERAEVVAGEQFLQKLDRRNKDGFNIYVCMNPLSHGIEKRTKGRVTVIRNVYVDAEEGGEAVLQKISASEKVPDPTVVVQTSPGKIQAVWSVEGFSPDEQEQLNKALVAEFGTDPAATDCVRVLRLPGFGNCKYENRPVAKILQESFDGRLSVHGRAAFKVDLTRTNGNGAHAERTPFVAVDEIHEGDGRNGYIMSFCSSLRARKISDEAIYAAAEAENQAKCIPPLDADELKKVIKSALRQEYKKKDEEWRKAHRKEEPVETNPEPSPTWVEPMRDEAFYGLAGQFVRRIEPETEADRHALLMNFLVMAGVQFGRNAYAVADGKKHYANEYVLLVGDSGASGRKGTATERTLPIFHKVDEHFYDHILNGLSTGEGLIKATQPKDYEATMSDCRSYLVLLSEYASLLGVMKREGNTMSAVLRNAWDTAKLVVLTRKDPLKVDNVNLSLVAHITPPELLNTLDATERANGFANRHLVVAVRRSKMLPEGGNDVDIHDIVSGLHVAVMASRDHQDWDGKVARNAEAKALWAEVYPHLTRPRPGLSGALMSRAEAHVLRLSLLYALLDSSREICVEHLKAALAVWDYCEASVEMIFGHSSGDPLADKILAFMAESSDGFALPTDISVGVFHRNKEADWIHAKMTELTREGRVVAVTKRTAKGALKGWRLVR